MLGVSAAYGEGFHNALSLQGFTGLLNTPNAEVTDEGKVDLLFSNQKESTWRDSVPYEENYMFSVGFFSFSELGGRLTKAPGKANDLSANVKIRVPFIPRGYYLPQVAFGMQDIGGGRNKLQTKYIVATEELGRLRFSLGYGAGPSRMDGVFGGVELKTFDWLYLLGEHDTKENNIGIRLITPGIFGLPVSLQATAKTSLDDKLRNVEFGIGLQIPLGFDDRKKSRSGESRNRKEATEQSVDETGVETADEETAEPDAAEEASGGAAGKEAQSESARVMERAAPQGDRTPESVTLGKYTELFKESKDLAKRGATGSVASGMETFVPSEGDGGMRTLRDRLVADGFQNVRVGADTDKTLLVVEYENSRYNHNELDGLGVVAGMAVETVSPDFEMVQLVLVKKGIRVLQLSAPLSDLQEFLDDPGCRAQFNANLEVTADVAIDDAVQFIDGDGNSSWLKSELVIAPGLKTFVGTEVGLFDYLLSVKPDYYLNAWKGAVLNARWDIPVAWSENFNDRKAFRSSRNSTQMDRLMLFQTLKVAPRVMLNLGAGMILHDTYGTVNEMMWTPGGGNHRFMLKQAYLSSSDRQAPYQGNSVYLGGYRYFFGPLDLYLEGTAGQFLDQDRGFSIELKRFFGNTSFSMYYKNSRTEATANARSERVQIGGVQISIPLTPRRDMKPRVLQVKGTNEWSYAQESMLVTPGERNYADTSIGFDPQMAYNLERVYYNRDRLSEDYIREHLLRLRDAYTTYRLK